VNKSTALLTEREAAAYLGRPAGALRAWRHDGLGPRFKRLHERVVAYRQSDLDAFLKQYVPYRRNRRAA
jgi:hypothetical protein